MSVDADRRFLIEDMFALTWFELFVRDLDHDHGEQAIAAVHGLIAGDEVDSLHVAYARLFCARGLGGFPNDWKNAVRMLVIIDGLQWYNAGYTWSDACEMAFFSIRALELDE